MRPLPSMIMSVRALAAPVKSGFSPGLDILRIVACVAVITIHASGWFFTIGNNLYLPSIFFNSFSRFAVPVFFMLTGYLLLDFNFKSIKSFYIKRYVRILVPFIVVCVLYFFTSKYSNYHPINYILYCLNNEVDYHLWYIYALIGIYAFIPFFIVIIQTKYAPLLIKIYLSIWVSMYILIPTIMKIFQINYHSIFRFEYFSGYFGYVLLGWYVKHNHSLNNIKNKWLFLIFVVSSFLIALSTIVYSQTHGAPNRLFYGDLTPFVLIQAVSCFILLKSITFTNHITQIVAKLTYWIYLIHILALNKCGFYITKVYQIDSIFTIPSMVLSTCILCLIISLPLHLAEQFLLSLGRRLFTSGKR